ncbi:MAG: hypothetical protein H6549_10425 [Chitinophagales bacterium]|nr:hypothetical protein [Chitinophagales bacterium]
MSKKPLYKKLLKIAGFILAGLILIAVGFHFWFISHSKDMLEKMVEEKSNGKLKLKIERLGYNYLNNKMSIRKAAFYTADSLDANTSYRFYVPEIKIKLKRLIPFLRDKKLYIGALDLYSPNIAVTKLRNSETNNKKDTSSISVPYEMGQIYRSIQEVLNELEVERFRIITGNFTLSNKTQPDYIPVNISDINLHIDNFRVNEKPAAHREELLFSDNITVQCSNQEISFPDGRHKLKFNNFNINLREQHVEFKDCMITGEKTDSNSTYFSVFFEKLRLSNVDFDTLYRSEVIKADTVFCLSPRFTLKAYLDQAKDSAVARPRLDNIIQQMTGDLMLSNVIVQNASFDISTVKNNIPNSFTSDGNDFQMQGLAIDHKAAKSINVKSFVMAIRNYENFIKDSSYRVQFDSIIFREDKIYLSNFLFNKLNRNQVVNSFAIPKFYLGGLSWDELIFNNKLSAEQATLFNPDIVYNVSQKARQNRNNDVFNSIAAIDDYVDLEYLDIQNGNIRLVYDSNFSMILKDATLSIQSRSLLHSTDIAQIKGSLNSLKFKDGNIKTGNLYFHFSNTHYTGDNGRFSADMIEVTSPKKELLLQIHDADIKRMQIDEKNGNVFAEDISWKKGVLNIHLDQPENNKLRSILELKNISGRNTILSLVNKKWKISTQIDTISFSQLLKRPAENLVLDDLFVSGEQLKAQKENTLFTSSGYSISDEKNSFLKQVSFREKTPAHDLLLEMPGVNFTPVISALIAGKMEIPFITADKPKIDFLKKEKNNAVLKALPIHIGQVTLTRPEIHYSSKDKTSNKYFHWQSGNAERNYADLQDIRTDSNGFSSLSIQKIELSAEKFELPLIAGKNIKTNNTSLKGTISQFALSPDEKPGIKGIVNKVEVKKIGIDSLGKMKGNLGLEKFSLKNFDLNTLSLSKLKQVLLKNPDLVITDIAGHYTDAGKSFSWKKADFNKPGKYFAIDSFVYKPLISKEEFVKQSQYQSDYIQLSSGKIILSELDLDSYLKNDVLKIRNIYLDNTWFSSYRDKRLPRKENEIKLLPVSLIKKIPPGVLVDSITVSNGTAFYSELDSSTNKTGVIPITSIDAKLFPVKNININAGDSLSVIASGYFFDSLFTHLLLKQSYTDSLGAFRLNSQMKPVDIRMLNSVLVPFASVNIKSGHLDTMSMSAVANEYLATGKMKMLYKNLKVELLRNGDINQKRKFLSFIANTFSVKKNNTSRSSDIYFERMRDRSIFQYIVRILINGAIDNAGLKTTKKALRKKRKKGKL